MMDRRTADRRKAPQIPVPGASAMEALLAEMQRRTAALERQIAELDALLAGKSE